MKIGGQVFDNIHKNGISYDVWIYDLIPRTGVKKPIVGDKALKALKALQESK